MITDVYVASRNFYERICCLPARRTKFWRERAYMSMWAKLGPMASRRLIEGMWRGCLRLLLACIEVGADVNM
jgi:hypothetical protein